MSDYAKFNELPIVPVFVGNELGSSIELLNTMKQSGLRSVEIAVRTPISIELIKEAKNIPDFYVGAGTITSLETLDFALDAGADFIVTPGAVDTVISQCVRYDIPVIPGVATSTEVLHVLDLGIDHMKLFPAEILGGVKLLQALRGPFQDVTFMPSGGVDGSNFEDYLKQKNVFSVSGSWMLSEPSGPDSLSEQIKALVRKTQRIVGTHVN